MNRRSRATSTLSTSLQKRLNTYAVATGAAGVSIIALAQPSAAEVIYTPANQTIGRHGSFKLDLNNDGIMDYIISEYPAPDPPYGSSQILSARAANGNLVNCPSAYCISGNTYADALTLGMPIGKFRSRGWLGKEVRMALASVSKGGSVFYGDAWANVNNQYMGLRFQINGETHFGWTRLSVHFLGGPPQERTWEVHLTGYAYETVAGKSIRAGQISEARTEDENSDASFSSDTPAQLGSLALGNFGIPIWRRED